MLDFEAQKVRFKASEGVIVALVVLLLTMLGAGYVAVDVFGPKQPKPRSGVEQRPPPASIDVAERRSTPARFAAAPETLSEGTSDGGPR